MRRLLLIIVALLALGLCFACGLVMGLVAGNRDAYHRRYLEERAAIAPIIAADPAFARVEVEEFSAGGVWLWGEVPSLEDRDRLWGQVVRGIGASRAKEAMRAVDVSR